MISSRTNRTTLSQAGMVSMMVTMIILLVITLIILGFAQVSRREQRQALDRSLSSQAFFAAESGVNDARKAIMDKQALGEEIPEKTDCTPNSDYPMNPVLDLPSDVKYTCLLVTTKLTRLDAVVSKDHSVNIPYQHDNIPATMHIDWSATPNPSDSDVATKCKANSVAADSYFVKNPAWLCPYGVLRVDFVPTNVLSRNAWTDPLTGQKTVFFYPTQGGGAATLDFNVANGAVARMNCKGFPTNCDVDITGMPATDYALRLSSVYQGGGVQITATDGLGAPLELKGAQIQVDATGKAQDVLRRIQVRLSTQPSGNTPDYALESGSAICKRFEISSDVFVIPGDIRGQDQNNPMCKTLSVAAPSPLPTCAVGKDIVLALDNSNSMYKSYGSGSGIQKIDKLKQVVTDFIDNSGVGPGVNENHEAIITFSGGGPELQMRTPLTSDTTLMKNIIKNIGNGSGTLYLPPLDMADADGWSTGQTRQLLNAKKILVFVTDGYNDTESAAAIIKKANTMKANGITIYTIGINPNNTAFTTLKAMASGSSYFTDARDATMLENIFKQIAGDVKCTP